MGIFTSQEDSIQEEDRESAFDRIEKQFLTIPDLPVEAHLCALFVGDNGVGKSGAATSYLKFLEDGECIVYVDLDAGDMDNLVQYWREEVANGKLRYYYPIIWENETKDGKQARVNYDKSIEEMRLIAMWILQEDAEGVPNYEKYNIKAVILDGISKLKGYAEYQMKNETNMDRTGDPMRKYWRIRNLDFLETLELYKVIPIDTIFVGREDFNKQPEKMGAIDRDTNDLVSQKLLFKVEEDEITHKVEFKARVLKSRQSFENRERELTFASIDPEGEPRACWEATRIYELLRPTKDKIEEMPKEEKPKKKKPGRPKKATPRKERAVTETPKKEKKKETKAKKEEKPKKEEPNGPFG
jgi:hypothetical protein